MTKEELNKLHPKDVWTCPNCGSKNVHCFAGMFVDRFQCMDCNWDWR